MCNHPEWLQHTGYRGSNSNWECTECGTILSNAEFILYCELKKLQKQQPSKSSEKVK